MTSVLHRNLLEMPPLAVSGDGVFLQDADGNRYLDACGGAAVSNLGHRHPQVLAAIHRQLDELPYAHTSFFTSPVLEELASTLTRAAHGMDKVLFVSGGSEAIEAALKLSRQHFVETGQTTRSLFVARRQSYHGNTLGALAVGGNAWRRAPFEPLLQPGHHIAPCYAYRYREPGESLAAYGERTAAELERKVLELGPANVAAFVAETVGGATSGAVTAVPGYFRRIREICDRYGMHLILDEVMCGTGRTGTLFAYEQEQVLPDMVTLAKGLGAGYQPIGALLARREIVEPLRTGSGYFQHGHTFMGHTAAAAAALATLQVIAADGLLDRVAERGRTLIGKLREALADAPHVGDVRGRGLFIGVEFVRDRATKAPFDPAERMHQRVGKAAMRNGLLCYAMGGTIDGVRGNHVLLAPPFTIDSEHEDAIVTGLSAAIESATLQ